MTQTANSAGLAEFLKDYSIEIMPGGKDNAATCRDALEAGTQVYIATPPPDFHKYAVGTAVEVRQAGLEPIPHVAGRSLRSEAHLEELVERLAGEAGVTRVLCVGGDVPKPGGPFQSSLQVIETGIFQKHGITDVGVSWYAEGNPNIPDADIDAALKGKLAYCQEHGLRPTLVGQFCFEAQPLVERIKTFRSWGITAPIRIGVAGPASRKTLFLYAMRCGIGNSIRVLGTQSERMAQLLTRDTPETLLAQVLAGLGGPRALGVEGIHFFTFGGVGGTAAWINTILKAA